MPKNKDLDTHAAATPSRSSSELVKVAKAADDGFNETHTPPIPAGANPTSSLFPRQERVLLLDELAEDLRLKARSAPANVFQLAASMGKIGPIDDPIVWEDAPGHFVILSGHGRVEGAKQLGLTSITCKVMTQLSFDEAHLITLESHLRRTDLLLGDKCRAHAQAKKLWDKAHPRHPGTFRQNGDRYEQVFSTRSDSSRKLERYVYIGNGADDNTIEDLNEGFLTLKDAAEMVAAGRKRRATVLSNSSSSTGPQSALMSAPGSRSKSGATHAEEVKAKEASTEGDFSPLIGRMRGAGPLEQDRASEKDDLSTMIDTLRALVGHLKTYPGWNSKFERQAREICSDLLSFLNQR